MPYTWITQLIINNHILRYKEENLTLGALWISEHVPTMNIWLNSFVSQFKILYANGMLNISNFVLPFVYNFFNLILKGINTAEGVFRAAVLLAVNDIPAANDLLNMIACNGFLWVS